MTTRFYATGQDLLPLLSSVEEKIRIKYTLTGHFIDPNVRAFRAAREIKTLFEPAPFESSTSCPTYLVTPLEQKVIPRRIDRLDGTVVWAIDQLFNPDSVGFSHGGIYKDRVLLPSEVSSAHRTPVSTTLQRSFDSAFRRSFSKVEAYRVGKEAAALLDAGFRLVAAEQSPREFDLRR